MNLPKFLCKNYKDVDQLLLLCSFLPKIFPILEDGRVKPFSVYLETLSQELSLSKEDTCLLNFSSYGFIKDFYKKNTTLSYTELENSVNLTKKESLQVTLYKKIAMGESIFFYKNNQFVPIRDFLEEKEVKEKGLLANFQKSFEDYKKSHKIYPLYLEVFLVKGKIVFITFFINLLSFFVFFLHRKKLFQKGVYLTTFLLTTIIIVRVLITERGPVTNMYETVLFAALISLLLGIFLKNYYSLASLIFSLLSLMNLSVESIESRLSLFSIYLSLLPFI